MTKRFRSLSIIAWALMLTGLLGSVGNAQAPQGIVVVPPTPQIAANISVDKQAYQPGERIRIFFDISVDAYVYVIDIDATGRVTQIFPNVFSQNNFLPAGQHVLPDSGAYSLVVTPPAGQELVQIIASLQPIDLGVQGFGQGFPDFGDDPGQFQAQAEAAIQGIVATGEVATAFTSFQVGGASGNNAPVARFTASPPSPSVGQSVLFDASSSFDSDGFITGYEWDFNADGSTDANGARVNHTFFAQGQVQVQLTVRDNGGRTASTSQFLTVGRQNQAPTARFTATPNNPTVGQTVQFDAGGSSDPDGFIASYEWDFNGDGLSDASGVRVSRAFFTPGQVQVRLTVRDNGGQTASTNLFLTVGQQSQAPTASFNASPINPSVGQTVQFDAGGSFDPDGFITSYSWDFNGDGFTDATGVRVNHTYFSQGQRRVTLTVRDNGGLTATAIQIITVGQSQPALAGFFLDSPSPNTVRIRVQGDSSWSFQQRSFRILLETDGVFASVNQQGSGNAAAQGIVPVPNDDTLELRGFVGNGSVTYLIGLSNDASQVKFTLELDIDGDGDLERRRSNVFLGDNLVNPPSNPFVLSFSQGNLRFDATLRVCLVLIDQPGISFSICFRFNL